MSNSELIAGDYIIVKTKTPDEYKDNPDSVNEDIWEIEEVLPNSNFKIVNWASRKIKILTISQSELHIVKLDDFIHEFSFGELA